MKKVFITILISIQVVSFSYGYFTQISEFGAREIALAGAGTGFSVNPSSVYYNSANLRYITKYEIISGYQEYYIGLGVRRFNVVGAVPFRKFDGALAVAAQFFMCNGYMEYEVDSAFGYGFNKNLGIGINLKRYNWSASYTTWDKTYDLGSYSAFALDVGINYRVQSVLKLGINVKNINQPKVDKYNNNLALKYLFGVFYRTDFADFMINFDITSEKASEITSTMDLSIGAEKTLFKGFNIRAGIKFYDLSNNINFNMGCGYWLKGLQINYAYAMKPLIGYFNGSHIIGLRYRFGEDVTPVREKYRLLREMEEEESKERYDF